MVNFWFLNDIDIFPDLKHINWGKPKKIKKMNHKILFIKNSEIKKIFKLKIKNFIKAEIISAICRANTLSIIKRAGSGHLRDKF